MRDWQLIICYYRFCNICIRLAILMIVYLILVLVVGLCSGHSKETASQTEHTPTASGSSFLHKSRISGSNCRVNIESVCEGVQQSGSGKHSSQYKINILTEKEESLSLTHCFLLDIWNNFELIKLKLFWTVDMKE